MGKIELRDYQQEAIDRTFNWFAQGGGNPLIVAPTGAGKSVILSELIRKTSTEYPGTRIICATHVKELIAQNCAALMRFWPQANAGIYSAGLNRRQTSRPITFVGIQSVAKRAEEFGFVDLLIVDEAHLIPRNGATQYQKFIAGLKEVNPDLRVIGLTATPFRLDSGRLDQGKDSIFNGIAYDISIPMLVERGYLAPLISKQPGFVMDTTGISTRGGDFVESEMNARFNTMEATKAAVEEIVRLGHDRKSWLLFCISVDHATSVCEELQNRGIEAATVTGSTSPGDRAFILKEFKVGRLRAITNVNVLTTGFDAPATDLLAFLRPTQSLGLYMQMAGRAMRIAPDKENGLVLDYAGNVIRHGPVDGVNASSAGAKREKGSSEGDGTAPGKVCPECKTIQWTGARECRDCGYEFPEPEPKIEKRASTAAIMNMTSEDDWRPVQDMALNIHIKADAPQSLRVEYLIEGRVISEWVCLEHSGYARQKAVQWWHQNAGTTPPDTVAEAMIRAKEVRVPAEAVIRREGKYERITRTRGIQSTGEAA
ncbi:MAG: DEAD/DEAH box helicase family protein [Pseudomonadota bacterium]